MAKNKTPAYAKVLAGNQNTKVRTRIAPSPTGFAHVGTAYTALFNYAFARKNGGSFIIRLEDTDVKRHVQGAEGAIYAGLSWLGIEWDEGPDKGGPYSPYRQSERLEIYKEKARELLKNGLAYEDGGAIRFKNPGDDVSWDDLVRGRITFPGGEVGDFVLLKSDGYPTYHFGVVVDDILMEITHVIRGEEHISNTPKHLALYKGFGEKPPYFAHLPTLRNPQRQKLSKRRDPVDLRLYREQGYLPEALVNFLCLLGWSHPEEKEIFSLSEFVEKFSLDRVRKAGPVFDVQKLDWLNGVYIRGKNDEDLAHLFGQYIAARAPRDLLARVAPLIKERVTKLSEVEPLISFFWQEPQIGKNLFEHERSVVHLAAALHALGGIKDWNLAGINKALDDEIKEKNFKVGDFYMSLRLALTGKRVTPPINESIELLGQDKVLHRLEEAQKVLLG
ncbi:MAG: glutamate--tRNA ligase [Candidatus Blackburnbacteria bacterium]|nr:glutamate--tRNA ligase [Candidatus Blackburnbacteria bacterium]